MSTNDYLLTKHPHSDIPAIPHWSWNPYVPSSTGLVLTRIGSLTTGTSATTTTFTAASIGTPATDRLVLVVGSSFSNTGGSSGTMTACTIGGTSATIMAATSGRSPSAIAYLVVSSGSTADIVTTTTYYNGTWMFDVYTLTGWTSSTPYTHVESASAGSGTSRTISINYPASGIALYISGGSYGPGNVTWSSATALNTYNYNNNSNCGSIASAIISGAETPHTETVSSPSFNWSGYTAAVWR